MKPSIETQLIRSNLRLYAELGKIPAELIPVIESSLGLDYIEEQAKKRKKDKLRAFSNAMADVLEEFNVFITMPMGKCEITGDGILLHLDGYTFDERTLRRLPVILASQRKAEKRIHQKAPNITVNEAKQIFAEEKAKIENFVKHKDV